MGCEVVVGGAVDDEFLAIVDLFEQTDEVFSRFRGDSELSGVNAAPEQAVLVTPLFARAVRAALAAAEDTDGLVDLTVGAAIAGAGYTRDFAELRPDPKPAESVPASGWRAVALLGNVLVRPPSVPIDLNGVVKGMTVDSAAGLIAGPGFVSAGGDIATRDGVVVGLPGGGSVTLERGGLATSGTARRWWRGGERQHHLIDPRTGCPADSPWREVTVVGGSCLAADVSAKAAFLLGADGPEWLDERGLPGRFVGTQVLENERWRTALGHTVEPVAGSLPTVLAKHT